ncbi:MAG: hypothetical protein ACMG6E_05845 [Candidatus Roizmanbacteria bacterium]
MDDNNVEESVITTTNIVNQEYISLDAPLELQMVTLEIPLEDQLVETAPFTSEEEPTS